MATKKSAKEPKGTWVTHNGKHMLVDKKGFYDDLHSVKRDGETKSPKSTKSTKK